MFSTRLDLNLKPQPFKHLFSTTNFTSILLNCFVLEHSVFKTKQLRSVLVKLLVLKKCLKGQGLRPLSCLASIDSDEKYRDL